MPAEFDKLRQGIKQQLLKSGKSEKDAEDSSWAIATAQWKKTHGGKAPSRENYEEESLDSEGRYIVAENVKIYIEAGITNIEE